MKSVRHVYNDDFYKITAVLLSKKFLVLEKELQNSYDKANLSLPEKGFSGEEQYREWLKKAMTLPNSPGKGIEDILALFNLDPKSEYYRNCLTTRVFFHKMPWEQSPYSQPPIELTTRDKDAPKELWVKIYPWTKKSEYVKLWASIKDVQKTLPGYRGKEKLKITFERNFAVYQLYLKAKRDIENNNNSEKLSIEDQMTTYPEYESISKKFKGEDFSDNIRSITSDLNKRLLGVDIL